MTVVKLNERAGLPADLPTEASAQAGAWAQAGVKS